MQKLGMTREGLLRQQVKKGDGYEDLEFYGILREEFDALAGEGETEETDGPEESGVE
jgi:hypothetical protein